MSFKVLQPEIWHQKKNAFDIHQRVWRFLLICLIFLRQGTRPKHVVCFVAGDFEIGFDPVRWPQWAGTSSGHLGVVTSPLRNPTNLAEASRAHRPCQSAGCLSSFAALRPVLHLVTANSPDKRSPEMTQKWVGFGSDSCTGRMRTRHGTCHMTSSAT